MSKIQITEITTESGLHLLSQPETDKVYGGAWVNVNVNVAVPTQVNANTTVQTALNGSNFNLSNLNNGAGIFQS